jgi:hypothetical protein
MSHRLEAFLNFDMKTKFDQDIFVIVLLALCKYEQFLALGFQCPYTNLLAPALWHGRN